ncbi:thermonuclease family protein [Roseomonas sp. OT10]|uniref:thermonuclease family protein n=1 Tax=Roseomonas cutis TaxID=2897332 RepID=UPI001E5FFF62|nr:thermonuclease family protein [Roseomonas sp. OT10]UFN51273.1 thermonuclease family protein [Roseomonas sp. OT10]
MLQRRRIFRPAPQPRRWRGLFLVAAAVVVVALFSGVGIPTNLLGSAPSEQRLTVTPGEVRVVDGETLRLGDRVVRLEGVEAPVRGQSCSDPAGRSFDCGARAAERLAEMVAERPLTCRVERHDAFRRAYGLCEAGGTAINRVLVAEGWALASSDDFEEQETAARTSGRGLWARGGRLPQGWHGR